MKTRRKKNKKRKTCWRNGTQPVVFFVRLSNLASRSVSSFVSRNIDVKLNKFSSFSTGCILHNFLCLLIIQFFDFTRNFDIYEAWKWARWVGRVSQQDSGMPRPIPRTRAKVHPKLSTMNESLLWTHRQVFHEYNAEISNW